MIAWPAKDPEEVADYSITFELDEGDTLATVTSSVVSGTVVIDDSENTTNVATLWLSGGVAGETALIQVDVVTAGGREFQQFGALPIVERNSDLMAEFRIRYPGFAAVADNIIAFWLADSNAPIDTSFETHEDLAHMLWAAHQMTLAGYGSGAEAQAAAAGTGDFKVIRDGTITLERFDRASNAAQGELASTSYGRQFATLQRQLRGGPRVAPTGALPYPGGHFVDGEA